MAFGMFTAQQSPVAIDFGSSSVKLLQIGSGDKPPLVAAGELPVPDSVRAEPEKSFTFYEEWLPKIMRDAKVKGKRAVIAVPASQTFIQHMQISETEGVSRDEIIKGQLQAQMGVAPSGVVVRSMEVCPVTRNGMTMKEMICFAITKETVMRYVELLKKCKLEVVGVHTDTLAMIRAFDHVHRRDDDTSVTTMYVDLGWGGTRVAITHGKQLMFSRYIPVGGKHFDQLIVSSLHCDIVAARSHRLTLQQSLMNPAQNGNADTAGMPILAAGVSKGGRTGSAVAVDRRGVGTPPGLQHTLHGRETPRNTGGLDLTELLDTVSDELSMCLRYHQGLFPQRKIDRAIFVGGESRQSWLCQHIVKVLRVPAQLGDPLARLDVTSAPSTPGLALGQPQPGWAVTCGLCNAPTDL